MSGIFDPPVPFVNCADCKSLVSCGGMRMCMPVNQMVWPPRNPVPLTESDIRRIVREEIAKGGK